MTQEPNKIYFNSSTYVTRVNGRLVMIRRKREKLLDICRELLRDTFGKHSHLKMVQYSNESEGKKVTHQKPITGPFQDFSSPPMFNPNANLAGPPLAQPIPGSMGLQAGIYKFGNRQLALLPLNPQGGLAMPPELGYPYYHPSWMHSQGSNMGSLNYPPMGTDPRQPMTNPLPDIEVARQAAVTVTKHICAECGRLRSRKYQHEHPLKPGETPIPALCKKCQKDVRSTDESEGSLKNNKKQHRRLKKGSKASLA